MRRTTSTNVRSKFSTSIKSDKNSITRRSIIIPAVLKIPATASSSVGYLAWFSINTTPEFIALAKIYNQFRLCKVRTRFNPKPFYDTASPTYVTASGVVAHEPTSDGNDVTLNDTFDLLSYSSSKLWASTSMGSDRFLSLQYNAPLTDTLSTGTSFGDSSSGQWVATQQVQNLAGNTIFSATLPDSATRATGDITVLQMVNEFSVEFREPHINSVSLSSIRAYNVLSVQQELKHAHTDVSGPIVVQEEKEGSKRILPPQLVVSTPLVQSINQPPSTEGGWFRVAPVQLKR